jgi:hypothetical protein
MLRLYLPADNAKNVISKKQMRPIAFIAIVLTLAFSGCQEAEPGAEPRIHGDAGVRIQSRDMSRISPER